MKQPREHTIISKMSCKPSLLRTEKNHEFEEFHTAMYREVLPRGALEELYFEDFVRTAWEILRLSRAKTELVKAAYPRAVESLILTLSPTPDASLKEFLGEPEQVPREEIALDWISKARARKAVSDFLKKFELDEFAIEAEAIALSMPQLEKCEQMISSLERRRDRALSALYWHREYCASCSQKEVNVVSSVEGANVRRLERASKPRIA